MQNPDTGIVEASIELACGELRLGAVEQAYRHLAEEAAEHHQSREEYLLACLTREVVFCKKKIGGADEKLDSKTGRGKVDPVVKTKMMLKLVKVRLP